MNARLFKIGMGIFIIAFIIILIVVLGNNLSQGGTRAGETYLGGQGDNCGCHPEIISNWTGTDHADADGDFRDKHGTNVYNDSYCGPCHTLGWNEISLEGFDTGQHWNSTYNQKRWMIQCENCHGPASAHVTAPFPEMADYINLDRDSYISCFGHGEAGCHSGDRQWGTEEIPGWNQSAHAPHDNEPETDHGMNTYCAQCKSPSQWDPEATRTEAIDIPKYEFRGITCGDCHNSHEVTPYKAQLRWSIEETCDACHNGDHHETVRTAELSGEPSVDRNNFPYMDNVTCVDCHMFETSRSVPDPWRKAGHYFQPTIEACVNCHTDVYDNLPYEDYPHANWTAWNETLQDALEEWGNNVSNIQDAFDYLIADVEHIYQEAEEIKEVAEGSGRWTPDLDEIFEQSEYDFNLADHQSRGTHNPDYAMALLNASKIGFNIILDELSTCILKGVVNDTLGPIEGVNVSVNGQYTLTNSNGMYSFIVEEGTYTVNASKDQILDESVSGVSCPAAAVIWLNFTVEEDFDNDSIPDYIDEDDDNDGVIDVEDAFPYDPLEWEDTDLDGIGDNADLDDDGDEVTDDLDAFPKDPLEWEDSDSDGIGDNTDTDDDGDGILDEVDVFPYDPLEWEDSDSDGTGNNADLDDDNDGYLDTEDDFPQDTTEWKDTDSDNTGDNADLDDDGDGVLDVVDAFPLNKTEWSDNDDDNIGDNLDPDDDNDGHLDEDDFYPFDKARWKKADDVQTSDNLIYIVIIIALVAIILVILVLFFMKGKMGSNKGPEKGNLPPPE
jgi:hypothetical protein